MKKQLIMPLINLVLQEPVKSNLPSKQIKTSRYVALSSQIPDDVLVIDEVFPEEELDVINERFQPYLKEYGVYPFLGVLGGNVVAIGFKDSNHGKIFYYDFDFGIFELDATLDEFLTGLQPQA